ncbi:fungal-specific transcription factor domain-containing protein [Sordaria brevicollis]|uniref:Fungal-specific transcription factor domain-containing protein n=1 Tax=Sordaria brevicollis TaxID=83679 RepID=A0AAE0U571_SORBR|nr:fungal-specific transcription factor domain-containing protein [Sordaria brevicollis]
MAGDRRSEKLRRRKIPLACEPCRERKSRCDGGKPICSTCERRSLPLEQCIYTIENARTASNDEYVKALHDRIRQLERLCAENGVPTPPIKPSTSTSDSTPAPPSDTSTAPAPGAGQLDPPRRISSTPFQQHQSPSHQSPNDAGPSGHGHHHRAPSANSTAISPPIPGPLPPLPPPPLPRRMTVLSPSGRLEGASGSELVGGSAITAIGTVSTEQDDATDDFYGSSSAASFMKEASNFVKSRTHRIPDVDMRPTQQLHFATDYNPLYSTRMQFAQADKFALPTRALADHLLKRYFERVYWLYPFFHKPTFERAYESLWTPANGQSTEPLSPPGLGLGSAPGADASTIVFHFALNTIFALGCQFADLSPDDKASALQTYFDRAKAFVSLDLLDLNNIGVVQALLLMTIFLLGTPFPQRCWNSVGVACRLAQGLGLHTELGQSTRVIRSQLETEIRRRTWHGCVILDLTVSMTYGRPTMTAHLDTLALPSLAELDEGELDCQSSPSSTNVPSKMYFYLEHIQQCHILGEILSSIYQSSLGRTAELQDPPNCDQATHGLDAILELDEKLSRYERSVNPIMSWTSPTDLRAVELERRQVIITQRTVLHGNFLYLRLMLHRPILLQLCRDTVSNSSSGSSSPTKKDLPNARRALYTSFAAECARICISTATDLIELVHSTYRTNTTGGWCWDALYAFTAGIVVILGQLCPAPSLTLNQQRLERSWRLCEEILAHFASFSISAHTSLEHLRRFHGNMISRLSDKASGEASVTERGAMSSTINDASVPNSVSTSGPTSHLPGQGYQFNAPFDLGSNPFWQPPGGAPDYGMASGSLLNWDPNVEDFIMHNFQ